VDRALRPGRPSGTTRQPDAVEGTRRPGPVDDIEHRAKATGQEAEFLAEAGHRLESVTSLLSAAALGHVALGDLADAVPPIIAVLDDAARFVHLAGER
jgi:hypothetical protein